MDDRDMKRVIFIASLISAFIGLSACESHDWDEVKPKLYPRHDQSPAGESH